jgi:hypothetical protein
MLPAMARIARVAACTGWTLKKPARAVVSSRNVCRLFISGQYRDRMDLTDGITDTKRGISFINLATLYYHSRLTALGYAAFVRKLSISPFWVSSD